MDIMFSHMESEQVTMSQRKERENKGCPTCTVTLYSNVNFGNHVDMYVNPEYVALLLFPLAQSVPHLHPNLL